MFVFLGYLFDPKYNHHFLLGCGVGVNYIYNSGAFRDQILIHVLYRLNKCCHSVFKLRLIVHNGNKELVSSTCDCLHSYSLGHVEFTENSGSVLEDLQLL
jgi:hypothetical protein